jgi:hypothetical protein
MRIEELKRVRDQRPFRPFWIRMADGREIEVRHPDAISWGGEHGRILSYISPADEWEVIHVALVTSLGSVPASSPTGEPRAEGNGG